VERVQAAKLRALTHGLPDVFAISFTPADWWGFGDIKSNVHFFTRLTGKKVFNVAFTVLHEYASR